MYSLIVSAACDTCRFSGENLKHFSFDSLTLYFNLVFSIVVLAVFSARQHAERAVCYRKSVCLSVRLFVTQVDQSKTVEVRIMQFALYSSPIPLVFTV